MAGNVKFDPGHKPESYRIEIQGKIRVDWSDWLSGMEISIEDKRGCPVTVLNGSVADQAALRGILCKLWDLNLTILSVFRDETFVNEKEGSK